MKILLATDGSETSAAAVQYVAAFPFPAGTEVTVVSVIKDVLRETQIESLTPEQWDAFENTKDTTEIEVGAVVGEGAAILQEAGYAASISIRTGHPAAEIIAAAGEIEADLIVVGSHGLTGFKRFLLGSVSNQVLQSADRSVLIVRKPEADCDGADPELPAQTDHPWRILVCYDGSDPAEDAVDFCSSLDLEANACLKLLTVLPMVRLFRQDIRQELNWIWQENKDSQKATLAAAAERLRETTAEVSVELIEAGDISDAILAEVDEFNTDLIILGHKGKSAVEKLLMGSVTARIAHHACRSVLAIR
jgi:nucleotide-binding universal stress UspA family protein